MAPTNGPERLGVYQVSYVIWSRQDGEEGQRRRELRESCFGGTAPEEAAAHAARWAKESCRTAGGWRFDGVEIAATRYVYTMGRCEQCAKFGGPKDSGILCLCEGLRCKRCGRRNIWRPGSTYYDEEKGGFWLVSHVAVRSWCEACVRAREDAKKRFARERPWGDECVLFGPGTSITSAEELRQLCAEPLIEALLFLAVWAPGAYGTDPERCDSTFVVLSFRVSENTSAYVQFLSDPLHQTVLWEVSSLDYQPGLADRLTPDRQAALVACGFEIGASPSNYRREVVIDSDASAGKVAHEALDILFEVVGYRGEESIVLHVEAERVAADGEAPGGFEPGRLAVLLRQEGYGLRVVRGAEPTEDRRLEVRFGDDVVLTVASAADGRSFRVFTRLATLAGGDGRITDPRDHLHVVRDLDGTAVLSTDVAVEPGATEEGLLHALGRLVMEALEMLYGCEEEGPS